VASARELEEGCVYFAIGYIDEDMLYPSVRSYIYVGTGLLGGADEARTHFFQTVETYRDAGNFAPMSGAERDRLGPDAVLSCDADDLDLLCDASGLIDELIAYRDRASRADS